jgi:hypothetical protein
VAEPSKERVDPSAPTLTAVTVAPSTPSWDEAFEAAVAGLELDELLSVTVPEIVVVDSSPPPLVPLPPESQPIRERPIMRSTESPT